MKSSELYELSRNLSRQCQPHAWVTVIAVTSPSSAYIGAQAIVKSDGEMHGWIGGGCVQSAARAAALRAIATAVPQRLRLSNNPDASEAVDVRPMACASNGEVELFIQPEAVAPRLRIYGNTPIVRIASWLAREADFDPLTDAEAADLQALTTSLAGGSRLTASAGAQGTAPEPASAAAASHAAVAGHAPAGHGAPGLAVPGLAVPGLAVPGLAAPSLAVSGVAVSGVAAPSLAVSGVAAPGLAAPSLAVSGVAAPGLAAPGPVAPGPVATNPAAAACTFAAPAQERETYALIATQGDGDEAALESALRSCARAVLVIASKRKAERLRKAMELRGIAKERIDIIRAPAGPDIGAVTPNEIALAAVAGLVALRRGRLDTPGSGRDRSRADASPTSASTSTLTSTANSPPLPPANRLTQPVTGYVNPVCGAVVDPARAMSSVTMAGQTHYFCCQGCRTEFDRDPAKYLEIGAHMREPARANHE